MSCALFFPCSFSPYSAVSLSVAAWTGSRRIAESWRNDREDIFSQSGSLSAGKERHSGKALWILILIWHELLPLFVMKICSYLMLPLLMKAVTFHYFSNRGWKLAKCILFSCIYIFWGFYVCERESMYSETLIPSFWLFNKCWWNLILSVVSIPPVPRLLASRRIIFRFVDFIFFNSHQKVCYCAQLSLLGIDLSLAEMSVFLQSAAASIFFLVCLKGTGKGEEKKKDVTRLLLIFLYFVAVDAHLK